MVNENAWLNRVSKCSLNDGTWTPNQNAAQKDHTNPSKIIASKTKCTKPKSIKNFTQIQLPVLWTLKFPGSSLHNLRGVMVQHSVMGISLCPHWRTSQILMELCAKRTMEWMLKALWRYIVYSIQWSAVPHSLPSPHFPPSFERSAVWPARLKQSRPWSPCTLQLVEKRLLWNWRS